MTTKNEEDETPLSKILSSESRWEELCDLLDDGKYWKLFAAQINTPPKTVTKIIDATVNIHFSPSRYLLTPWQHKKEATVGTFLKILEAIGHHTAHSRQ